MARLHTSGFESRTSSTTGNYGGEADVGVCGATDTGTLTFNTSVQRSGGACLEADQGAANRMEFGVAMTLDRAYFFRAYVRWTDTTPSTANSPLIINANSVNVGQIRLETDGTLTLRDSNNTAVGSPSAAVSPNTWYRLELKIIIPTASNGTLEGKLDGTTFASSSSVDVNNSVASSSFRTGSISAGESGVKTYIDDLAINDDQGANQNSWPGVGKVIVLRPVAHSALGNWVGPQTAGDDTTDLWDNVNNTPPVGVAHSDADANATLYCFNVVSSANNNLDMAVSSYTAGGIVASDVISLVQAVGRMSVNTTTGTNTAAVAGVSNPAITARTALNLEMTAIAGSEPTGWKTWRTSPSYAPSVTLGTQPVVRVQKEVANTNAAMVDLMGLLVEYAPVEPVTSERRITYDIANTVQSERRVVYSILNTVQSERRVTYDIRNAVQSERRITYNIANTVVSERRIVYDIEALGGPGGTVKDLPLTHAG